MELCTKCPVPLTTKAQRQLEGVRCGVVGGQNTRSVEEFKISIKAEHKGIPLFVVSPAYINIECELRVQIYTNAGLKMLRVNQIHTDVTGLSGSTGRQAKNGGSNSAQNRSVNTLPKSGPVIGVFNLEGALHVHFSFGGVACPPSEPVQRIPHHPERIGG